jgi:hypothetical protein
MKFQAFLLIQKSKSHINGKELPISSVSDLANAITTHNYSGGVYAPKKRSNQNWKKTNILILDIDEPQAILMGQLSDSLSSYLHIIAPTKSHLKQKGAKPPCERYRLILFLDDYIYSPETYVAVIKVISKRYGLKFDLRAIDVSHFFWKSEYVEHINQTGDPLSVSSLLSEIIHSDNKNLASAWNGYALSKIEIPEKLMSLIKTQKTATLKNKFEEFIRILMAQHNLVRSGESPDDYIGEGKIPISQVHFAKVLRVDVRTFRKWLNLLLESNQLRVYSSYYGKGWTSRKYVAQNELKQAIIKSYVGLNRISREDQLPSYIEDGDYDRVLFWAAKVFQNDSTPERYFNWARSIPGFKDKPDREHHIHHKWNCVKKYKDEI